jgi:hypothetical protein
VYRHAAVFALLLYPMQSIALTATIYTMVAIVHERYVVVAGNRSSYTDNEKRRRLSAYLSAVVVLSVVINLPKFFEITWVEVNHGRDLYFGCAKCLPPGAKSVFLIRPQGSIL